MAAAVLLFGQTAQKTIGGIQIDAFVDEGHEKSAEATEYPVEDGARITDHVISSPDTLSLTCVVGVAPLGSTDLDTGVNRPLDVYDSLTELMEARETIEVVTGLKVYQNMIITGFSVPRTKDNGRSLEFTMSLKKIEIRASQSTAIPSKKLKAGSGGTAGSSRVAQSKANTGKAQAAPVESPAKRESFLTPIKGQMGVR